MLAALDRLCVLPDFSANKNQRYDDRNGGDNLGQKEDVFECH
jgi:hypothetical protein